MKTIRVSYDEPARSKSRNVNAYTRAVARRKALSRELALAVAAVIAAGDKLTGGQIGEAQRVLSGPVAAAS
jgi:hypothetical protein